MKGRCGVKQAYLSESGNKCFCTGCEPGAGKLFRRGSPQERYVLPEGWCRFGVRVDEAFVEAENVWDDWS